MKRESIIGKKIRSLKKMHSAKECLENLPTILVFNFSKNAEKQRITDMNSKTG